MQVATGYFYGELPCFSGTSVQAKGTTELEHLHPEVVGLNTFIIPTVSLQAAFTALTRKGE
jgi:hypothetical protein